MSGYKSAAGSPVSARSLSTELLSEIASRKAAACTLHTWEQVTYKRRVIETSHDRGQYNTPLPDSRTECWAVYK